MIQAHTFDAWTRPSDRASLWFARANILAGFAAPLFLWLAGLGAILSAARSEHRSASRAAATEVVCRRGLKIFILAFLFRLQAFIVTPGSHPIALFRVDILNIMGPGIVITGLIWGSLRRPLSRTLALATASCAVAMTTPIVRTLTLIDSLPTWIQWYVRPAGEYTTFTSFPWVGFVFAGAACAVPLGLALEDPRSERRVHLWLALSGFVVLVVGLYAGTLPTVYRASSYWTSSPTYFALRVGIIVLTFSAAYALAVAFGQVAFRFGPLERLGRSSLFVYWIHVELVYGYATWMIHRRLPLEGTVLAFIAFAMLMYGAVVARDGLVQTWLRATVCGSPAIGR
jgi:uncharacterized membrane protein